jgi:hypothetical protein
MGIMLQSTTQYPPLARELDPESRISCSTLLFSLSYNPSACVSVAPNPMHDIEVMDF